MRQVINFVKDIGIGSPEEKIVLGIVVGGGIFC